MNGETARILVALRAREPALKAMGVERVALFGSVARGEAERHGLVPFGETEGAQPSFSVRDPDGHLIELIEPRGGLHAGVRPRTGRYLRACQLVTAVDYLQANRRRAVIMQEVARAMANVDVVMFTTLTLDSRTSLNPVMSLTGHPSIAVPNGFQKNGSPAGVMFAGHLYREDVLVALARWWQSTTGDAGRQPPLFQASSRPA